MGEIIHTLIHSDREPEASIYEFFFRIETCELIHVHWGAQRIVLTPEQFKGFIQAFKDAEKEWNALGCCLSPEKDILLAEQKLPNNTVKDPVTIELNKDLIREQCVHIHYKDNRLELSVKGFLDYADSISQAAKTLKEYYESTNTNPPVWPLSV